MATYSVNAVEVCGRGVLKSEGVVVDKENDVSGGGRNAIVYQGQPRRRLIEVWQLLASNQQTHRPRLSSDPRDEAVGFERHHHLMYR